MTDMKFPLFKIHIPVEQALDNIREVFLSGFINEGTQVTKLTTELSKRFLTNNLLLVNSCTSALTLALKLSGVSSGDEVVTTPMTCVASNTPVSNLGGTVVWADVDPMNGMIDNNDVAKKITPKTKAVVAVAWAGTPPDLLGLKETCRKAKVKLILDAAHAFGATYFGMPLSSCHADFVCYSFQAIKHFTTGDGGALICADRNDFERAKALKWFGLDRDKTKDEKGNWKGQQWDTDVVEAGYKFNMNNLAAAIGIAQLDHIDRLVAIHRRNAALYTKLFKGHVAFSLPSEPDGATSAFWVYTVVLQNNRLKRDDVLKRLNNEGIAAGLVHVPNDAYTCFKSSSADLPGVRSFSQRQFSLPCGWWLSTEDIAYVAERVKEHTK